jgi:hypothetical protein
MIERNKHKINRPFYDHIKRVQGKDSVMEKIKIDKREIDQQFYEHLKQVQGQDSLMFLVMDRTQIQPEIKMVYRLHNKFSELPEHYKFYSFDLDSNLPSIYSE